MSLYRDKPTLFDGRVQPGLFDSLPLGGVLPATAAPPVQTALMEPPQGYGPDPAAIPDDELAVLAAMVDGLYAREPQTPGLLAYRELVAAEVAFRNDDPERKA